MKQKQVIITSLGNTLEWFDFALFVFFAPIISQHFFPTHNPFISTLITLSVFAAGFICRPLGGILFGHAGDTHGRAKTLRISVLLITICTLLIGMLPSYSSIGIYAPIAFTLIRLIQGISIGGEYSGVMIYLAESAPSKQRGLITSFAAIGANLGFLLATIVLFTLNHVFSQEIVSDWAWRLPFIFIGIGGLFLVYYRFQLAETPTFSYLEKTDHIESHPFFTALRYAPKQLLIIFGLTGMGGTLYYVFFGYMPTYLQTHLGYESKFTLLLESTCLVIMLFLVPIAGWCGDRIGRKRMLITTAILMICLALPCFFLLKSTGYGAIILAFMLATFVSSFEQGNSLAAVVENCPANVRYSGIAFSYNLGNAIFGGTAPLMITLITQYRSLTASAYYLMAMASITLIAATGLVSKTRMNYFLDNDANVTN